MIEEIGRCVAQKVSFRSHTVYERHSTPVHARAAFQDETLSHGSVYETAASLDLKPGEMMAVWKLPADEQRPFAEMIRHLPSVPSRLLVRTADKKLLELNQAYIHINNRVDDDSR